VFIEDIPIIAFVLLFLPLIYKGENERGGIL